MIPDAICLPISAVAQQAALDRAAQAANPSRGREVFLQSLAIAAVLDLWQWLDLGSAQGVISWLPGEAACLALPQVGSIVLLPVELVAPDFARDGIQELEQLDFGLEAIGLDNLVFDFSSLELHELRMDDDLLREDDGFREFDFASLDDDFRDLIDDLVGKDSSGARFGDLQAKDDDRPSAAAEGPTLTNASADDEEQEAIEADSPAITNLGDLFPIDLPIDWPDDAVAFVPVVFTCALDQAWLWGWVAVGDVSLPPHAPEQLPTERLQDWEALEPYLQRVRMALAWIAEAADPIAHQVRQTIAPESRSSLVVRLERRYQAAQHPAIPDPGKDPVIE
ncbi:MAG TPA: hypothetical protein V6D46_07455, partial [Coleofasciculaceae cyanobacterium]